MSKKTLIVKRKNQILIITACLLLFIFIYLYCFFKGKKKEETMVLIPTGVAPTISLGGEKESETDIKKLLSLETVKTRKIFDLNSWLVFEDKKNGLRFKYPSSWGKPEISETKGDVGSFFSISFPNIGFIISGTTLEYSYSAGASYTLFHGFTSNKNDFPWDNIEKICQIKGLLFCQKYNGNIVHMLSSSFSSEGLGEGRYSYYRLMFLNRPGKVISGLVFGGPFVSEKYAEIDSFQGKKQITGYKTDLSKAILERKLDEESMTNFDTFEKVFETVESF